MASSSAISEGENGGLSLNEPPPLCPAFSGPLLCDNLPEVRGDTSCYGTIQQQKEKKKKTSKFSQFSKHKIKNNYKIGRLIITECDKIRSITIWEVSEDVNENGFINTKNPSASPPESSKTISPPARVVVGILDKWDVDGETLQDLDKNSKEESRGV